MDEGARLEIVCPIYRIGGSNPSPSADNIKLGNVPKWRDGIKVICSGVHYPGNA